MIYEVFMTPLEVARQIASSAKEKRLLANLSQKSLSDRSGVSLGVLKKFESTGKISLESLLKLAVTLDGLKDFISLFKEKTSELPATLDELLKTQIEKEDDDSSTRQSCPCNFCERMRAHDHGTPRSQRAKNFF